MSIKYVIAAVALLGASVASAQVTASGAIGSPQSATIDFTGVIESSIRITVNTRSSTVLNALSGSTGEVDFGSFSTVNVAAVSNGRGVRTTGTSPIAGAHVIAQMTANVTYSGATVANSGAINLVNSSNTGTSPIAANNVKMIIAPSSAWTSSADGTAIASAAPGTPLCTNCVSGAAQDHEIALFIPDTQAAGDFSSIVTYTGTAQ